MLFLCSTDSPLLPGAAPLLTLAVVLIAGVFLGGAAKRVRLPSVTGQILAGVLIGGAGLHLFGSDAVRELEPLKEFALGLMGVTVGAHLNVRRLRNAGKRLFLLLILESVVTPLLAFGALRLVPGIDSATAILLAALAISTAPATIVALVKESRSRGVFVKTLVAAVAMNNMACVFLFEITRVVADATAGVPPESTQGGLGDGLEAALGALLGALIIGGIFGLLMTAVTERALRPERLTTYAILALLLTYGVAAYLDVSPLLACMFLGIVQTNSTPAREDVLDTVFEPFEPAILAIFFTLAGMKLSFEHLSVAGIAALVFFLARGVGKVVAAGIAMKLAGAPSRVQRWLGVALLPQAGLAIGLVVVIEGDPAFTDQPELVEIFLAVVLTSVTLNEIAGPIATRYALRRSGEAGKDRTRLIDFLQEENIVTELMADNKGEVIERLTDVLISSHHLKRVDKQELLTSVLERERQISTCLGGGLFVPHGDLPEGSKRMYGVMGISREGLRFQTPDGHPVHCVVLLATPPEQRQRHLEVLAALAKVIGKDPLIQQRLFEAKTPAHAYEILHGEEAEGFNYFLDDE